MNTLRRAMQIKEMTGGWADAGHGRTDTRGCLIINIGRAIREEQTGDISTSALEIGNFQALCDEAKAIVCSVIREQHPEIRQCDRHDGGLLVQAHTELTPAELDRVMEKAAVAWDERI